VSNSAERTKCKNYASRLPGLVWRRSAFRDQGNQGKRLLCYEQAKLSFFKLSSSELITTEAENSSGPKSAQQHKIPRHCSHLSFLAVSVEEWLTYPAVGYAERPSMSIYTWSIPAISCPVTPTFLDALPRGSSPFVAGSADLDFSLHDAIDRRHALSEVRDFSWAFHHVVDFLDELLKRGDQADVRRRISAAVNECRNGVELAPSAPRPSSR
jgi:hypothetical protein